MSKMKVWLGVLAATLLVATTASAQDGKAGRSAAAGGAEVGKPAPEFELKDTDGKVHKLSDYKDKVVVLEWFNKDCPVCRKAMPKMKELAASYSAKGVVWLAVDSTAVRTVEENKAAKKDEGIAYPILMDNDGKVGRTYGAKTTPHMFIINKGTLVYAGAHDNGQAADKSTPRNYIQESLDAILAGKPVPLAKTDAYGCSVKYKKNQ